MPFPVDQEYIKETELELDVKFPSEFKSRMSKANGGELFMPNFEFELYPFFDKTDRKRISRTCNHIGLETKNVREWDGFPEYGIAIGADGFGNKLILTHKGDGNLTDELYLWNHETKQVEKIAESINKLYLETSSFWKRIKSKFNFLTIT
ncbi:SMI1/KNR4 family protein [Flavobacteriaceae bacterium M23B6Z8]